VVATIADGMAAEEVVTELPDLTVEDLAEALRFAAEAAWGRELLPPRPA